jgi:rubredoxin
MRAAYEPARVDASCLPHCLFEIGRLTRGLPVWSCPKCTLFYNSAEGVTAPTCAHCGLAPRTREQLPVEYQTLFTLLDEAEAAGRVTPMEQNPLPQPIIID